MLPSDNLGWDVVVGPFVVILIWLNWTFVFLQCKVNGKHFFAGFSEHKHLSDQKPAGANPGFWAQQSFDPKMGGGGGPEPNICSNIK